MSKQRLSHVRASMGLSQADLADAAGIGKTTVVDAEKRRSIRLLTAYAILNALNKLRAEKGLPELTIDSLDWNVLED